MPKKPRVGSNPLNWIQDTRDTSNLEKSSKPSKHESKPSKPSKQSNAEGNASKMNKQSKQEKPASHLHNHDVPVLPEVQQLPSVPQAAEPNKSQQGLPDGWSRATFIVRQQHLDKIKAVAYWERMDIKEVIEEALTAYLSGKNVKPIPPKRTM